MSYESMKPFGMALLDYANGKNDAAFFFERDDGFVEEQPVSVYFRKPSDFFQHEHTALDLCNGHILDIGAGAGIHSLYLQDKGFDVTAIDILPEAVEVMSKSGVKDSRCADIFNYSGKPFNTLLLLGRGIGMVENLLGLESFLSEVKRLLKSDGQLILNSCDVSKTSMPEHLAYQELNTKRGRYIGEIGSQLRYKNFVGKSFSWLHVDPKTLAEYSSKIGWHFEVVEQEIDGNYLARLTFEKG